MFRFTEAFERYQTCLYPSEAMADSVLRGHGRFNVMGFESGIECAKEVGDIQGAADLIDTLIVLGRASETSGCSEFRCYQLDNLERAHGIWEQGKIV